MLGIVVLGMVIVVSSGILVFDIPYWGFTRLLCGFYVLEKAKKTRKRRRNGPQASGGPRRERERRGPQSHQMSDIPEEDEEKDKEEEVEGRFTVPQSKLILA
jgi:hypothetical protein